VAKGPGLRRGRGGAVVREQRPTLSRNAPTVPILPHMLKLTAEQLAQLAQMATSALGGLDAGWPRAP
jgi:hypothetical protein